MEKVRRGVVRYGSRCVPDKFFRGVEYRRPDEVASSSLWMVRDSSVYDLIYSYVRSGLGVDVLGIDAPAGYGKSKDAVRLAIELSYDGWLVICAFHSHELGRKLFEYALKWTFLRLGLAGKWYRKLVRLDIDPIDLPRLVYVGGMERYCPFIDIVASECKREDGTCVDEKICNIVKRMLSRSGVPSIMWDRSVKYLIEHKLLNAKEFCNHCPFMRRNGRLRRIPRSYWPDKHSRFGPRIMFTKDVEDLVEKYLFPLLHCYYRRKGWKKFRLAKYVKKLDPLLGVCPRRLLLKPTFSKRYVRKSDGKVVYYNFWLLYHGGVVIFAPYELALRIARIAYRVRGGRKILLIIDEADALLLKKDYVPVFSIDAVKRELELVDRIADFLRYYKQHKDVPKSELIKKYLEMIVNSVSPVKVKLSIPFDYILSNYDVVRQSVLYVWYLKRMIKMVCRDVENVRTLVTDPFGMYLRRRVGVEVSDIVCGMQWLDLDAVYELYKKSFRYPLHDLLRVWNIVVVLSLRNQKRIGLVKPHGYGKRIYTICDEEGCRISTEPPFDRVKVEVVSGRKLSVFYALYLVRNTLFSIVLRNNMLYIEYYPYLREILDLALLRIKIVLMSATLNTLIANVRDDLGFEYDRNHGCYKVYVKVNELDDVDGKSIVVPKVVSVTLRVYSFVRKDDLLDTNLRKRVVFVLDEDLRYVRVHRFIDLDRVVSFFKFRTTVERRLRELLVRGSVVIVTQNKLTARFLAELIKKMYKVKYRALDSGYYFDKWILVTWLRSKLNRGVDIASVDPRFVPRFFIFVGTFASSALRAVNLEQRMAIGSRHEFGFVYDRAPFFVVRCDRMYMTEVACWIEQFLGRALRISRLYNVRVVVIAPPSIFESDVTCYSYVLLKRVPDIDAVRVYVRELEKRIDALRKIVERCSRPESRERYLRKISMLEERLSDPVPHAALMFKWICEGFGVVHLYNEVVDALRTVFRTEKRSDADSDWIALRVKLR